MALEHLTAERQEFLSDAEIPIRNFFRDNIGEDPKIEIHFSNTTEASLNLNMPSNSEFLIAKCSIQGDLNLESLHSFLKFPRIVEEGIAEVFVVVKRVRDANKERNAFTEVPTFGVQTIECIYLKNYRRSPRWRCYF